MDGHLTSLILKESVNISFTNDYFVVIKPKKSFKNPIQLFHTTLKTLTLTINLGINKISLIFFIVLCEFLTLERVVLIIVHSY